MFEIRIILIGEWIRVINYIHMHAYDLVHPVLVIAAKTLHLREFI